MPRDLLTVTEAAKVLGWNRRTLSRWIAEDKVAATRVGAVYVIRRAEVERLRKDRAA